MVGATGLEPAASCSQGTHSTKLSYAPIISVVIYLTMQNQYRQQNNLVRISYRDDTRGMLSCTQSDAIYSFFIKTRKSYGIAKIRLKNIYHGLRCVILVRLWLQNRKNGSRTTEGCWTCALNQGLRFCYALRRITPKP